MYINKEILSKIDSHDKLIASFVPFTQFMGEVGIIYDGQYSREKEKDYWKVIKDFSFYPDKHHRNEVVLIHKGFRTDGASSPRITWPIIPPWGRYGPAVIVHDYLCVGGVITSPVGQRTVTRKEADKIFLEAMRVLKVPKWKRLAMYVSVRAYAIIKRIS